MTHNIDSLNYFKKIVNNAKNKLQQCEEGKLEIRDMKYKDFLVKLANKKCPNCGRELEISKLEIKSSGNGKSITYEFSCGHKHSEMCISEKINIWEKVKGKARESNKRPHRTFMIKTEPGKNKKSENGVQISWSADRKNNKWSHTIKDIKTGKILHSEKNKPLDQHK